MAAAQRFLFDNDFRIPGGSAARAREAAEQAEAASRAEAQAAEIGRAHV